MLRSLRGWAHSILNVCLVVMLFLSGGGRVEAEMPVAKGTWDSRFTLPPGLSGPVSAMASVGNYLVAGGSFTRAGKVEARFLALWDGKNWKEFAGGANGPVTAMILNGTGLYVCGWFTEVGGVPAQGIARWNGYRWDGLNANPLTKYGYPGGITEIYWQNGNLYAGGNFSKIGGISCNEIARWDGRSWHGMEGGILLPAVDGLAAVSRITGDGRNIYVGGIFSQAGSIQATNLARWDGAHWHRVGDFGFEAPDWIGYEPISWVDEVRLFQGSLYVWGGFTKVDGNSITNFARWNGSSWEDPGGVDGLVEGMDEYKGGLLVAGRFNNIGGVAATNVAMLKQGKWSAPGVNTSGRVSAVKAAGNRVYLGGTFELVNGVSAGNIVQYDGARYSALGVGKGNSIGGVVQSLAYDGTNVYVAGNFDTAGTLPVSGIAKWDGTKWSSMGKPFYHSGINEIIGYWPWSIPQVALAGSKLYLNGNFEMPDVGATNLACWNGKEWSAVGGVTNYWRIESMVSNGEKLYVSGWLGEGRGVSAWDGTNWTAIPWNGNFESPMLAADGTNLYMAKASFSPPLPPAPVIPPGYGYPPAEPRRNFTVAKWDGQTLTDYGVIPDVLYVNALAARGNILYAAGLSWSGTMELFRWKENAWEKVPLAFGNVWLINSIVLKGEKVYVGGYFESTNGSPLSDLVEWNGKSWRSLGLGDGSVNSMISSGNKLFVGGNFVSAGGKESGNFGVWTEGK